MGKYGIPPVNLGLIDIQPTEMMFWLNLPIKMPHGQLTVPPNLAVFEPIITASCNFANDSLRDYENHYVYITAKTLYFDEGQNLNRPGWHSDGFLTDDLNFIWSNSDPTIFWTPENFEDLIDLPCDHQKSLDLLDDVCENWLQSSVYPEKHLLALNQYVIHKCAKASKSGVRTFVKISFSKNKYDMKGNSVNHLLNYDWKYFERCASRNLQSSFENIGLKTKI